MENRFEFGENWSRFLASFTRTKVSEAERSLTDYVGDLANKSFLDIGSGSGLFSLAARNLGARVVSFDYDPTSVKCTQSLKERLHSQDDDWHISHGDVLNAEFMEALGRFDVVYSWGVLHHTGKMWQALEAAASRVADGGTLFIAIYNDQGGASKRWAAFKKWYLNRPALLQDILTGAYVGYWELRLALIHLIRGKNPLNEYKKRKRERGMETWHDARDWLGGYPFEVAKPEELLDFYRDRGFTLVKMKTCAGGHGCNEFVFRKDAATGKP